MADGNANIEPETATTEAPTKPEKKVRSPRKPKAAKAFVRDTSSIAFPYLDLESGISVARAFLDAGGVPLSRDQLAGALKLAVNTGNFISRTAAARIFGLMENKDGKYQLTELGFSIIDDKDEKRQRAARMEAFLAVPLYRRVYDEFKGKQLPPRPLGLEQAFVKFGVAPKQKDRARHAFDKSARQAGFFTHGEDRLVEPIIGMAAAPSAPVTERRPSDMPPIDRGHGREMRPNGRGLHLAIEGLLQILPPPQSAWSMEERQRWLTAAGNIFDLIYTLPKDDDSSRS